MLFVFKETNNSTISESVLNILPRYWYVFPHQIASIQREYPERINTRQHGVDFPRSTRYLHKPISCAQLLVLDLVLDGVANFLDLHVVENRFTELPVHVTVVNPSVHKFTQLLGSFKVVADLRRHTAEPLPHSPKKCIKIWVLIHTKFFRISY